MPVVTAIFLLISLMLAAVVGPQMRMWTWGFAMIPLGLAVLSSVPSFWRKEARLPSAGFVVFALLLIGWFGWGAWASPVAEFALADGLLLAVAVGACLCFQSICKSAAAERILLWGIAGLLLASVLLVWKQAVDEEFVLLFRDRLTKWPSAFASHYNEGANFMIGTALLLGGAALFGKHAGWMRALWGTISVAGLVAVYFTLSRGGILAAVVGISVFGGMMLLVGAGKKTKWFVPLLVTLPLLGIAAATLLYTSWDRAQDTRTDGRSDVEGLMDDSRLPIYNMAVSCISKHPLTGGGSRSFSWEAYHVWQPSQHGQAINRPDMAHNELLQTATDYGLVGLLLVIGLLGACTVVACVRSFFHEKEQENVSADAWRVGGIAAMAGMFTQSCFSFVFHLLPGVMLLGICLGRAGVRGNRVPSACTKILSPVLLTSMAIGSMALLLPYGWKASLVTKALWPVYYKGGPEPTLERRIDAFTKAIDLWPQASFYQSRAMLLQAASNLEENTPNRVDLIRLSLADYLAAAARHPKDPTPAVNAANLLSQLDRTDEAEQWYERTLGLQGNMEPAFRGHYYYADHLRQKGMREFEAGNQAAALRALEKSAAIFESGVEKMAWQTAEHRVLRAPLQESLGAVREANGDFEGALAAYDFATTLQHGQRAHYRAGALLARMAVEAWQDRRAAEAMWYFHAAKPRIQRAGNHLPEGVTAEQRAELIAYIDQTVAFLKGAAIEPKAPAGKE